MNELQIDERLDRIERLLIASKKVLTLDEASEYSGISKSYLYKLTAATEIPHSKPNGKIIYFDKDELDKYLLGNRVKTKDEMMQDAKKYVCKKHIDEYYKEWCGESHLINSCRPVHDSAEAKDFANFYHKEKVGPLIGILNKILLIENSSFGLKDFDVDKLKSEIKQTLSVIS